MPPPVTTRHATEADLDALAELFDAYRVFYRQDSDKAAARDFLAQRLSHQESVILIAEQNGQAVGFTQLYPSFSSVRMKPVWILNDLYVDDAARGSGCGKALLHAAERMAAERGAAGLMLETEASNRVAQQLYHGQGWSLDSNQHFSLDIPRSTA